jgi:hypothetical protein
MPKQHTLDCPPITARVSEAIPGWDIVVRLLGLEQSHRTIMDLDAAKNAAIAYARELCRANNVNEPVCLNAPEWIERNTDTAPQL